MSPRSFAALLSIVAIVALGGCRRAPSEPERIASASVTPSVAPVSATSAPVASSSAPAPAPFSATAEFVYDCEGIGAARACPSVTWLEPLLDVTRWPNASGLVCGSAPVLMDWSKRVEAALRSVQDVQLFKLDSFDRVVVANALLRVVACSARAAPADVAEKNRIRAKALLTKITPTAAELAELSQASKQQLAPIFEVPGAWQRRAKGSPLHARTDAATLVFERYSRNRDYADVGRMVLLDAQGVPHSTDVVGQVMLLRFAEGGAKVCIAEARPALARCKTRRVLQPIAAELGKQLVHGGRGPPCRACHSREPSAVTPPAAGVEYTLQDLADELAGRTAKPQK